MRIFILLVVCLVVTLLLEPIVTAIYNHFGQANSTSEADNKQHAERTGIDRWYYDQITRDSRYLDRLQPQTPTPVPEIDVSELTREKFIKLTDNFTSPLVVRGFFETSKACKRWNLDYFQQRYGDTVLPIIRDASMEQQKRYLQNHQSDYTSAKIRDLVDQIKRGGKSYLNNVSRIFGLHPELLDDMELGKIEQYTGVNVRDNNNVTHMFVGGRNTGSSLHCSITGNFFYNVKGHKRWILIHPKYSRYLLPNISKTGLFVVSHFDVLNAKRGDPVLNLPRYDFTLREGDLFFNPPWWWHAVRNETPYTIGCANRFSDFGVGLRNNPLFTLIFFSHPIANYQDFGQFTSKRESNLKFDQALLRDILRKRDKV